MKQKLEDLFLENPWLAHIIILCLGAILYSQVIFFGLNYLDDNVIVFNSHQLKDIRSAAYLWFQPDFICNAFYRPLLNFSFMLDNQWAGQRPWGYHLTTFLFHLACSCLVFPLLRSLSYSVLLSLAAALVFTVHPALTQVVSWIPGRTDSLLAVFIFWGFIFFVRACEANKIGYKIGHLLCFFLALFVKETAVVLPVVCTMYLFLIRAKWPSWQSILFWAAGWGIPFFIWDFLRITALAEIPPVQTQFAFKSILENFPALLVYWGKTVFLFNLSVLPYFPDMSLKYGAVALIFIIVMLVRTTIQRKSYIIFGFGWFIIFLLPSLGIGTIRYEYRLYVPLVGALIVFWKPTG